MSGLTVIEPNEAVVLLLFGKYVGTIRQDGLVVTMPFTSRKKLSLRVRQLKSDTIKIQDQSNTPRSIFFIIIYHVVDTAKAQFYANQLKESVQIESEIILIQTLSKWQQLIDKSGASFSQKEAEIKTDMITETKERFAVMGLAVIE